MTGDASANNRKGMVSLEDAKDQVRRACERLALLHYSFARALVDELGDEKGKQIAMNAIKLYASLIGEGVRERVRAQGLEEAPDNYMEDLPAYGMNDGSEVVYVDGEKRTRVTGCVMGKLWCELGARDLGRIYCYVDPAKYMAYNPDFKQVHEKALPDGDDCCEMAVRPTTQQDREEFSRGDADLAKLDT